ncbi:protein BatD [Dyella choica]|uniref:Protein BatD n=2 Tax=Dyella choica TaxID=1927959 RepID=A0A3S0PI28_9GAMM|nr:protein BatD [Dyella choica]
MAMAAKVQATLDRTDVHLGETVTLNLHIGDAVSASTPDLSALVRDFEVLRTSTNSSLSLINGRQRAELIIGVALRPRHEGDLKIPSLTVAGSQTNPLNLHVGPADISAGADAGKDVFVEATASSNRVYAGQQILYTVRLFYSGDLDGGSLPNPDAGDAELRQLGNDISYESVRHGRRYHVVERRYALTPRHAGALTIPAIEFQGEMIDRGNPSDPGGFFNPGGLFGNTTPVSADSPQVKIDVEAPLANWGETSWLPARSLSLSLQGLPGDDKISAGQPLNLRLSVDAQGLSGDALPTLSLPAIDGATVYPDQPSTSTHDDGEWLIGHSERGFAIFPQHAGSLTLPPITLTWFEVQSGQKRVATIPSHTLTVLAANGTQAAVAPGTQPDVVAPPTTTVSMPSPANAQSAPARSSTPWRWIALGSIALWLLSAAAFAWLYRRRHSPTPPPAKQHVESIDSSRAQRQAFLDAARGEDRPVQAQRLLAWARAERPGLRNLGQVASALDSGEQRAAIELLHRAQYADVRVEKRIDLAAAFDHGLAWRQEDEAEPELPLPPLYPFKLD